ncbi:MAG: LysR family transcriptional regulator, partial [Pigmentiphaga sp.]|uniref:LysR family transcriptional regulator n=1 Tax=Pigmentiphaga sp. TaxID=1977564 RepID=UPI0029B4D78C
MDQTKQLESFVASVALGSFSAAARAEGVAANVVRERIDALESRLGAKLLHRNTRGLRLTDNGARFYEACRAILADLEQAETAVSAHASAPNRPLKKWASNASGTLFSKKRVAQTRL